MRLDGNTLVLSEKNLLSLLTKLYTKGSRCEIRGGEDCPMSVRAETDDKHYGSREYGPGPMHPVTEKLIDLVRKSMRENKIGIDE